MKSTVKDCEDECKNLGNCTTFSFDFKNQTCYTHNNESDEINCDLKPNILSYHFDSRSKNFRYFEFLFSIMNNFFSDFEEFKNYTKVSYYAYSNRIEIKRNKSKYMKFKRKFINNRKNWGFVLDFLKL